MVHIQDKLTWLFDNYKNEIDNMLAIGYERPSITVRENEVIFFNFAPIEMKPRLTPIYNKYGTSWDTIFLVLFIDNGHTNAIGCSV